MRKLGLYVLPLILFSCSDPETRKETDPEVSYTEVLRIPGDTLFTGITDIEVRSNGNIIVSETMRGYVTELAPDGSFIRRIGRQGDGPGEFRRPWMIEMIGDSLFLFDNLNYRLNVYDKSGSFSRSMISEEQLSNKLFKTKDGYINFMYDGPDIRYDRTLYNYYDKELNKRSVDDLTLQDHMGSYFEPVLISMFYTDPIHAVAKGDGRFLVNPQIYMGKIYEYIMDESGSLLKSDSLTGLPVDDLYYKSEKYWDHQAYDAQKEEGFGVRLKSLSLGLFQLSDGRIIHFVMKDNEQVREIGVELFSEDHDFLGYSPYQSDSTLYDEDRMRWSFIKAFDGDKTFYTNGMADNGEAELVVFELELKGES